MKILLIAILTIFTAQAEMKIEIFDAQGNKIKEVITDQNKKTNIIEQHEIENHNQKIKIQKLEKENKKLKEKIKNLENQIAKLNSDIKIKDFRLNIQDTTKELKKDFETNLTFLKISQYLFMAFIILSIIAWIISLFTKNKRNERHELADI